MASIASMTLAPICLDNVTSLTAVTAPNRVGKSTLLKALMGELSVASGSIDYGGPRVRDFGHLPQPTAVGFHREASAVYPVSHMVLFSGGGITVQDEQAGTTRKRESRRPKQA